MVSLENVFQAAKQFVHSGQQLQALTDPKLLAKPYLIKKEAPFANHEPIKGFKVDNTQFPLEPKSAFYNFMYCKALAQPQNEKILKSIVHNNQFDDINYFRVPNSSKYNTQAEACAIAKGLVQKGQFKSAVSDFSQFLAQVYKSDLLPESRHEPSHQYDFTSQSVNNNNYDYQNTDNGITNQSGPVGNANVNEDYSKEVSPEAITIASLKSVGLSNSQIVPAILQAHHQHQPISPDFKHLQALKIPQTQALSEQRWNQTVSHTSQMLKLTGKSGFHIIPCTDSRFSQNLVYNQTGHCPAILYLDGDDTILNRLSIALVGTRNPTNRQSLASLAQSKYAKYNGGTGLSQKFGTLFTKLKFNVVNGLATGCDAEALQGALNAGGTPIAFINMGLDKPPYPASTAKIRAQMKHHGAVITEYPINESTQRVQQLFVKRLLDRDEWQSGMSDAVLAMETDIHGGTQHAMHHAVKQGRPLAVPNVNQWLAPYHNPILPKQLLGPQQALHHHADGLYDNQSVKQFVVKALTQRKHRLQTPFQNLATAKITIPVKTAPQFANGFVKKSASPITPHIPVGHNGTTSHNSVPHFVNGFVKKPVKSVAHSKSSLAQELNNVVKQQQQNKPNGFNKNVFHTPDPNFEK